MGVGSLYHAINLLENLSFINSSAIMNRLLGILTCNSVAVTNDFY